MKEGRGLVAEEAMVVGWERVREGVREGVGLGEGWVVMGRVGGATAVGGPGARGVGEMEAVVLVVEMGVREVALVAWVMVRGVSASSNTIEMVVRNISG